MVKLFKSALGYLLGLTILCFMIGAVSITHEVMPALLGVASGLLCFPVVHRFICAKMGYQPSGKAISIAVVGLFIGMVATAAPEMKRIDNEKAIQKAEADKALEIAAKEQERQEAARIAAQIETERQKSRDYFVANRVAELAKINSLVRDNKLKEASELVENYDVADQELEKAKRAIELAELKERLKREKEIWPVELQKIYSRLTELEPKNAQYAQRLKQVTLRVEADQREQQQANAKMQAIAFRKATIERQLSSWDGSHPNVEQAIKSRMHNPSSYKHVETRYSDTGSNVVISTKFRGTNAFGGTVTNTAIAEIDIGGRVLNLTIN